MNKETTLCFTGHRPEKLTLSEKTVKEKIEAAVNNAIKAGYDTFITGLARGVDLWAGEIVLDKKIEHPNLILVAAKPFENFTSDAPEYIRIMSESDEVYIICKEQRNAELDESYVERDRWMVDNSSLVLAMYNGAPGGTRATIEYAKEKGVPVNYL